MSDILALPRGLALPAGTTVKQLGMVSGCDCCDLALHGGANHTLERATQQMLDNAKTLGANAVIGVEIQSRGAGRMGAMFVVTGLAVKTS